MNIVIVESQTKANLIGKFLGTDYQVIASNGSVRELPTGFDSVNPDNQFSQNWQVLPKCKRILQKIVKALEQANCIIFATNPDREGETNAWHILETLHNWNALSGKQVQRVTFNSLTKESVLKAFSSPRKLAATLIDAQRSQNAVDYLFHFKLLSLFSQKLPSTRVTDRDQAVALKLICDREVAIESAGQQGYWSLNIHNPQTYNDASNVMLTELDGKPINSQQIATEAQAESLKILIQHGVYQIGASSENIEHITPMPPYNTNSLLIDAARVYDYPAAKTIQIAIQLFEGISLPDQTIGLISYFYTASEKINDQKIVTIRQFIQDHFGHANLPDAPLEYQANEKNGYETHEAIRPTSIALSPKKVSSKLTNDQANLYELIWKRTIASQMNPTQVLQKTSIFNITGHQHTAKLTVSQATLQFDGFLTLYPEQKSLLVNSNISISDYEKLGSQLTVIIEKPNALPPARYSEATLVEKIVELGIGTPSNIASIIQALRAIEYIKIENQKLIPTDKGRIISTFFDSFCQNLVDPDFSTSLKYQFDLVSDGKLSYVEMLTRFWHDFSIIINSVHTIDKHEIIETLNDNLSPVVFPGKDDGTDPRSCPKCGSGKLSLRFSRVGTYVACSNSPDCRYTRQLGYVEADFNSNTTREPTKILGNDPASGLEVSIKDGRYGMFVQLGIGSNPKRVTLPPNWGFDNVDLATAVNFLALPREVGIHPDTGYPIHAGIGRFGPFVLHNSVYSKLNSVSDAFTVDLAGAVQAIAKNLNRKPKLPTSDEKSRELGIHSNGGSILLIKGRLGSFLKYGRISVNLPRNIDPKTLTLEQAIQLIDRRGNAEHNPSIPNY